MFLVNISEFDTNTLEYLYRSMDGKSSTTVKRFRAFSELKCPSDMHINENLLNIMYFEVNNFYCNEKIVVERQYFGDLQKWKELKRCDDATSRSFINFSPAHVTMIQNELRLGDGCDGAGAGSVDYVPLLDLSFDIETTTLDPQDPKALTLTICAQASLMHADRIEPLKRYIFQLGVVDPQYPMLVEHRRTIDVVLHEFPCDPKNRASCLAAEREMLLEWARLLQQLDPDTITGHNILRFDVPYLYERASQASKTLKRKDVDSPHHLDWGRAGPKMNKRLFKQTNGFRVPGRVFIDTYDVAREKMGIKLPGESKLDALAKRFLDSKKEDMPYREIVPCFEGTPQTRARLASYCLQDAILPAELSQKWVVHLGIFAEARMTFSPLGCPTMLAITGTYNYFGLYGGMEQKDREGWKRVWIPYVTKSPISHHDYIGGHVFDMIPGLYEKYVATLDFQSLYPMTMIAHNLCARSLVPPSVLSSMTEDEVERRCEKIWCDLPEKTIKALRDEDSAANGASVPTQRLHVFWKSSEVEGLTPRILRIFLEMRALHKKMLKDAKKVGNLGLAAAFDAQQIADKLVCNKTYGLFGTNAGAQVEDDGHVYHGHLPCVPVAEATCAWGRTHIKRVAEYATGPESLQTREGVPIKLIGGDSVTGDMPVLVRYGGNVTMYNSIEVLFPIDELWQSKIHVEMEDVEVWSDQGWTPIKYIIRHWIPSTKRVFEVGTPRGFVRVTEDHSLLAPNATKLRASEIAVGQHLLQSPLPYLADTNIEGCNASMGFERGVQFYNEQSVFDLVYARSITYQQEFVRGYVEASGSNCAVLSIKFAAMFYLVLVNCKYDVVVSPGSRDNLIRLAFSPSSSTTSTHFNMITYIREIHHSGMYVYDFETENHHFSAGVGELVVHNTDSVIIHVQIGKTDTDLVTRICQGLCDVMNRELPRPENLEFETVHESFLYYKKKNYAAISETVDYRDGKPFLVRLPPPQDIKIRGFTCLKSDGIPYVAEAQYHLVRCVLGVPFAFPKGRETFLPQDLFCLKGTNVYLGFDRVLFNIIEHLTSRQVDMRALLKSIKLSKDVRTTKGPQYDVARDLLKKHEKGTLDPEISLPQRYDSIPFIWAMKDKQKTAVHKEEIKLYPICVQHYLEALQSALEIFVPYDKNIMKKFADYSITAKRVLTVTRNKFANNFLVQK